MNKKSKLKRVPKRGVYDRKEIYKILDNNITCHIAFVHNGIPVSIPTTYGRYEDTIYIHGASVSRMLQEMEKGIDVCISIAKVTAMILSRSAFHHSANYESVVIFGKGRLVTNDTEKLLGLKTLTNNFLKDRWNEVREPNQKELNATKVIAISMDEISGKRREEGVDDHKDDIDLPIWAGIIPVNETYGLPIKAPNLNAKIPLSKSVQNLKISN